VLCHTAAVPLQFATWRASNFEDRALPGQSDQFLWGRLPLHRVAGSVPFYGVDKTRRSGFEYILMTLLSGNKKESEPAKSLLIELLIRFRGLSKGRIAAAAA
jgi:hypothetical protein